MSRFTTPKVFAPYEPVFRSLDLNAIVTAIEQSLNAVHDTQVASNAAIQGSKVADLGIASENLNASSVNLADIAIDAMTSGLDYDEGTSLDVVLDDTFTVIGSAAFTTAGGPVLLMGVISGYIDHAGGVGYNEITAMLKLSLVGYGDVTEQLQLHSYQTGSFTLQPICMVIFWVFPELTAAACVWQLEARQNLALTPMVHVQSYQLFALELR
jgi:hypothetical protein